MCTKIIFFIATLYVVKASVISLNAYDGDGSLADGIVDNEVEEYDTSLNKALVEDPEAEIAEVSSDPKDLSEKRRCSPRRCNRVCRLRRYNNGACVDGRCRCSNTSESDTEAEIAELFLDPTYVSQIRTCLPRLCNIVCQLQRLGNGTCVDGQCKCSGRDTELGTAELLLDPTDLSKKRRCSPRRCNRVCRLRRYNNGTCVDGRCRCSNSSESDTEAEIAELFLDPTYVSQIRICLPRLCNIVCQLQRLGNGTCVDGQCKCSGRDTEAEIAELFLDPTYVSQIRTCLPRLCNFVCQLQRLGNGTCVDGQCKCSGRAEKSFADDISDILVEESNLNTDKVEDVAFSNEAKESELNLDEEVEDTEAMIAAFFSDPRDLFEIRRCFPRLCNRLCRLKRFDNGICVQGRCKCENIVQEYTTTDATTE